MPPSSQAGGCQTKHWFRPTPDGPPIYALANVDLATNPFDISPLQTFLCESTLLGERGGPMLERAACDLLLYPLYNRIDADT
eukprot:4132896-Pyramimonas_sp.AAC.1